MQYNEKGRSLTEMIGVLAIIGVLAVVTVVGFRYAMSKLNANETLNDVRIAYMSIGVGTPQEWTPTEFIPVSGYTMSVRRDKSGRDFVWVKEVPDDICRILLNMTEDSNMVLYTLMNDVIDCQAQMQDIVFSFDGVPPLLPCTGIDDCPDAYNTYCNTSEKLCLTCALGQRKNSSGTGCVDLFR